jgi:hypothetical protein
MSWSLWLCLLIAASDLIVTRKTEGDVIRVGKKGEMRMLIGNLTLPTSAAAHLPTNSLYVSTQGGGIYRYSMQNASNIAGELIYGSEEARGLVVDVWGNLYFVDNTRNLIAVVYAGSRNATILYENDPMIHHPTSLALDDFNEFLFWTNGANGGQFGSVHIALKSPLSTGKGHLTSWLYQNETYDIALSHNFMYVSTASGVFLSNKHAPKDWERVTQLLSAPRVLAVYNEKVYMTDLSTGTLYAFKETESSADMSLVTWAPEGITHISVLSGAGALLVFSLLVAI